MTATGALFDIAHITCTLATLAVALVAWLDPGATSHSRRAEWAALIALAGAALLAAGGVSLGLLLALGAIGWIVQLWWWRP